MPRFVSQTRGHFFSFGRKQRPAVAHIFIFLTFFSFKSKKNQNFQTSVALIVFFNYYYTFLQLDPTDLADQLKRQGASIPAVRPGRATAEHITGVLNRMSILGSAFLGALAAAPPLVEKLTGLSAFRGFAGTSLLILVGVATDTARKVKAEQVREKIFFFFSFLDFDSISFFSSLASSPALSRRLFLSLSFFLKNTR